MVTSTYINKQLAAAQELLWDGALDKTDQASNIITKLINDLQDQQNS